MAVIPKLKPDLIIQRNQERPFRTSSALAMNSMFKQYKPRLAEKPVVTPELTSKPEVAATPEPIRPISSFQNNIGKGAESIGDFFSALASADLQPAPKMSVTPSNENSKQRLANPATMFAPSKLPRPTPSNSKKKGLDQEAPYKFKR
jgi:hypothetical protein